MKVLESILENHFTKKAMPSYFMTLAINTLFLLML